MFYKRLILLAICILLTLPQLSVAQPPLPEEKCYTVYMKSGTVAYIKAHKAYVNIRNNWNNRVMEIKLYSYSRYALNKNGTWVLKPYDGRFSLSYKGYSGLYIVKFSGLCLGYSVEDCE